MELPIDALLPNLVDCLRERDAVVLEAPPGAGKTTRVPGALFEARTAGDKEIVVLEPRRLATRLAATRVASERGESVGATVGYQVRFEDISSPKTRIRFLTEALLTRRLIANPQLTDVGAVVLDEFHERHLASDLALAMVRRLQKTTRPDLKLVVMSATLDAAPLAQWLDDTPALRSEGRRFDVAVEYLEREDERPLSDQVLAALKRLVASGLDGHVLVFLPGASEIRRASEACAEFTQRHQLALHVLHGDLPAAEQDAVLRPSERRKVILSTNVAETSVTIDGIAAVVDCGLSRVAAHSPWSGLPTLRTQRISKSSAIQRAGRAGRTRAGKCLRLYTKVDFESRVASDAPEIRRLDFVEAALALRALGVTDVRTFPFFEAPLPSSVEAAEALLARLGAIDSNGGLTPLGQRMVRFPLHPRLGRLLLAGEAFGVADDAVTVAALLSERDIRLESRARVGSSRGTHHSLSGPSDVLELRDRFTDARTRGAHSAGIDSHALQSVERVRKQLKRLGLKPSSQVLDATAVDEGLQRALLEAFPDRVAKRRRPKSPEVVFAAGGSATLDANSVVHDAELLVAVDAEERRTGVVVRLASQIHPEWLLELPQNLIEESDTLEWNADAERVDRVTRMRFGNVSLEETRKPATASEATSRLLATHALDAGVRAFANPEALVAWQCRIEALRQAFPEAGFPKIDDSFLRDQLVQLCVGAKSFSEIREAGLLNALMASLTPPQTRLLQTEAPDRITLPGGRTIQVHYELGRPPWIESRLQDFFGLLRGPSIGKAPLVLHLLAPNMRAVQVTTDLAGFWDRHYPAVRKELMRQYPKHAWPEDPKTATPPAPRRR
jgi:ATP-dependent helicase HrpB